MNQCGALLGLAIGDALGTTNEFEKLTAPPFPELATDGLTDIVGGGPFGLMAGQVTDDTQMACCLYKSLSSLGHFDVNDVAARYAAWSEIAFDIGNQTSRSLAVVAGGESALEAGRIVWLESGSKAAGNGSLMRTALSALFSLRLSMSGASLRSTTLPSPTSILAAGSPARRSTPRSRRASSVWATRRCCGRRRGTRSRSPQSSSRVNVTMNWRTRSSHCRRISGPPWRMTPTLYGPELHLHDHRGFVRVAFRLAFWELLHRATFHDAVLDASEPRGRRGYERGDRRRTFGSQRRH